MTAFKIITAKRRKKFIRRDVSMVCNYYQIPEEQYETFSEYLQGRSILKNRVVIPLRAMPLRNRLVTTLYAVCKFKNDKTSIQLSWLILPNPIELVLLCFSFILFLWCLFYSLLQRTDQWKNGLYFCVLFLLFELFMLFIYLWQYKRCNMLFFLSIESFLGE